MRFSTPGKKPVEFEIEDDWLSEAGVHNFKPSDKSYHASLKNLSAIVPLSQIKPPTRRLGVPDFKRAKMIPILEAFRINFPLLPIEVIESNEPDYTYYVRDGFHRFYASVAVNFTEIPVWIRHDV